VKNGTSPEGLVNVAKTGTAYCRAISAYRGTMLCSAASFRDCFTEDRLRIGILFFLLSPCSDDQMKARMTSSRYGPYKLGYTFATMKISKLKYINVLRIKCFPSTDRSLQFETREDGIASNRKSAKLR